MKKRIAFTTVVLLVGTFLILQRAMTQVTSAVKPDTINLLDAKRVIEYVGVPKTLQDSVKAKIAQIQKIVDEDKKIRDDMRQKVMSGTGQFSREAFQAVRAERDGRQKKIDALVGEIQSKLTEKQKEKFTHVVVPNLQEMARAERGQLRGRGERREQ